MHQLVGPEIVRAVERPRTDGAAVWFLPAVEPLVSLQAPDRAETLGAQDAAVGAVAGGDARRAGGGRGRAWGAGGRSHWESPPHTAAPGCECRPRSLSQGVASGGRGHAARLRPP